MVKILSLSLSLSLSVITIIILAVSLSSCGKKEASTSGDKSTATTEKKQSSDSIDKLIDNAENLTEAEYKSLPDFKYPLNQPLLGDFTMGKKKNLLILYRNSIFAQNGYEFKTKWIRDYFITRPWYKPGGFKQEMLTKIDLENINTLKKIEDSMDANASNSGTPRTVEDVFMSKLPIRFGSNPPCPNTFGFAIGFNKDKTIEGAGGASGWGFSAKGKWEIQNNKIDFSYDVTITSQSDHKIEKQGPFTIIKMDDKFFYLSNGAACRY